MAQASKSKSKTDQEQEQETAAALVFGGLTVSGETDQLVLTLGDREFYIADYPDVTVAVIGSLYNQIKRIDGDQDDSDVIAAITVFVSEHKTAEQVIKALKSASKAAAKAAERNAMMSYRVDLDAYNAANAETLDGLGDRLETLTAELEQVDAELSEHRGALSETLKITTLQIGWMETDHRFFVDAETLKTRSGGGGGGGALKRDYAAGQWSYNGTLRDVKMSVAVSVDPETVDPETGKTKDADGWSVKITADDSGKTYNGGGNRSSSITRIN